VDGSIQRRKETSMTGPDRLGRECLHLGTRFGERQVSVVHVSRGERSVPVRNIRSTFPSHVLISQSLHHHVQSEYNLFFSLRAIPKDQQSVTWAGVFFPPLGVSRLAVTTRQSDPEGYLIRRETESSIHSEDLRRQPEHNCLLDPRFTISWYQTSMLNLHLRNSVDPLPRKQPK
jgi:hypothetical protein